MELIFGPATFTHTWQAAKESRMAQTYPDHEADMNRLAEQVARMDRRFKAADSLIFDTLADISTTVGNLVAQSYGYDIPIDFKPEGEDDEDEPEPTPADGLLGTLGFVTFTLCADDCACKQTVPYTEDEWDEAHWVNEAMQFHINFWSGWNRLHPDTPISRIETEYGVVWVS